MLLVNGCSPTLLVGGVLTDGATSLPPPYRNAMCGKLQCSNVESGTIFGIAPSIISTPIGTSGAKCYGVDFMLGSDVPDPGMVNEGTKCGDNKVRRKSGVAQVVRNGCLEC